MTLGDQLKKHRTDLGLTIREMAKMFEVTPAWLSRLENHHETAMSDETARRVAKIIEVNEQELFRLLGRLPRDSMIFMAANRDLYNRVWNTIALERDSDDRI